MNSGIEISNLPGVALSQLTDILVGNQGNLTVQESLLQILSLFLLNLNSGTGLTDGQLLIGSTGLPAVGATITAGSNVSISNGPGTITIASTATPSIGWTSITNASATMVADNGYMTNRASLVTLTLPATAAFGTVLYIQGFGAGGWSIAQRAGQSIQIGNTGSTIGVTGSVASTNRYDSVFLFCAVANTTWTSLGGPQGGLTII